MKLEISSHKKNPLMKREEFEMVIEHLGKATPSRSEIVSNIAKKTNASKDLLIIDRILSVKGAPASKIRILTYKKKEDMPKYKLEKTLEREKRRLARKSGEAKEEVKPVEKDGEAEKKEEAKKEEPSAEKPEAKPEKPRAEEKTTEETPAKKPEEKKGEKHKK